MGFQYYMELLNEFFILNANQYRLIDGTYNYWLVTLSIFISIFASWISLYMLNRFSHVENSFSKFLILFTASLSMGGAVWSMHFIGMLSFELCTKVTYNKTLTILSILPSFFASYFALLSLNKDKISVKELIIVGVMVGSGIGAMHYMGMAAMEMSPKLLYDPFLFLVSLVVAITLAIFSIFIQFRLKTSQFKLRNSHITLISGIIMGSAISGMHYTGMAAARFVTLENISLPETNSEQLFLAIAVGIGIFFVIGSALATNAFISYKDLFHNLQKSESRLRAIIETAADAIVIINTKGIIREFNISAEKMFGWKVNEIVGQNINKLMPNPFQSEHDNYLEKYLKTGEAKIIGIGRETEAVKKDGTKFPIRLAIGHTKLPQDDVFVGFISDISERIKIENALKLNEERLKSFIQNIPGVVYRCLLDGDWTTVFMSDAILNLSGYPSDDFLLPNRKRTFNEIIHPDDRDHVANTIQNAIDTSDTFVLNYRIIQKTGDIRWVLEYGGLVFDEDQNIKYLDGVLLDNTDRKLIEEALIESKEKAEMAAITKTTFLANMSHEIRTPMNAIIGFTEILLDGKLVNQQKNHLETIKNSAKSLLRLLNDVLNSAKLDKGAVELENTDFSLISLVDQVCSAIGFEAKRKGLNFSYELSDDLEEYYKGDTLRIRQILTNLLGNAVKFTKEGFIKLTISKLNGQIHFRIQDSGIGIAADRIQKIFEPFTQADVSMSRKFGGTGLGTTISKQLVELMKGEIWVDSSLNIGSTFNFSLPLEKGNPVFESYENFNFDLPKLKILIVDDVVQNVELIRILMTNNGHQVEIAKNGFEAVEFYKSTNFDLVLMDIQMPEMDGLEATKQIRLFENSIPKRTPIIALSASVFEEDKISAKNAGMDGFVSKPIEIQDLFLAIAKVLDITSKTQTPSNARPTSEEIFLIKRGLQLFGSKEKYASMLSGFFNDQKISILEMIENPKDKTYQQSFLHKIKGVASNLGINPITSAAQNLEYVLQNNQLTKNDFQNLFIEFEKCHNAYKLEFETADKNKQTYKTVAKKTLKVENKIFINSQIDSLVESFSRGSVSQNDWNDIKSILIESTFQDLITKIDSSIQQFDFEKTIIYLNDLKMEISGD
ncbi:PAS domain S-box protein [Leptospira sp. 96542]|nr:PAS domain S-box protein [Leptospira sp. 96542]